MFVFIEQYLRRYFPDGLRVEHREVSVRSGRYRALAGPQAEYLRWIFRRQLRQLFRLHSALYDGLMEHQRKQRLNAVHSAPRVPYAAACGIFLRDRRGRVVGTYEVYLPRFEKFPQFFCVVPRPHRRRAFEDAAQPFEVFAGEQQVLRAGLDGGLHAAAFRLGDFAHDARQRGVADVDGSPRPLRLFENHVHGFFFRDRRMRREEVRDAGFAFCAGFGL